MGNRYCGCSTEYSIEDSGLGYLGRKKQAVCIPDGKFVGVESERAAENTHATGMNFEASIFERNMRVFSPNSKLDTLSSNFGSLLSYPEVSQNFEVPIEGFEMNTLNTKAKKLERQLGRYKVPYGDRHRSSPESMAKKKNTDPDKCFVYPSSGATYKGSFHPTHFGVRHGQGLFIWKNGASYEGEWRMNNRHGYGRQIFEDGDYYEGAWSNDKASGEGLYVGVDGTVYNGGFLDNLQHGFGEERREDGTLYVGEWKFSHKEGDGKLVWSNGCSYTGKFKKGQIDGEGNNRFII